MEEIPRYKRVALYGAVVVVAIGALNVWAAATEGDADSSRPQDNYCETVTKPAISDPEIHKWIRECDPPSYDDLVRWGIIDPADEGIREDDDGYSCPAGVRTC